jgi:hypothetical protein
LVQWQIAVAIAVGAIGLFEPPTDASEDRLIFSHWSVLASEPE